MKRTIPIVLVAGALAFAACGSSSSNTNNATATTTGSGAGGAVPTTVAPGGSTTATTLAVPSGGGNAATVLKETGSSLMYPYLEAVAKSFESTQKAVGVATAAGGSGQGVSDVVAGNTDFGASDAYLSPTETETTPGLVNIPVVVSSQAVDFNLKGIKSLKLSGTVLADMYLGTITKWNDPAIAKLNPGVTLPAEEVHPIHRSDSSGDSFLFSSFLTAADPSFGTKIGGPTEELTTLPAVAGAASADGNPGMVQSCQQTPGCVAYVGISAQASAVQAGLSEASLQNAAGNFELPTTASVEAAVAAAPTIPPSLAVSLIYTKGATSYPDVNFEYIITNKGAKNAAAIQKFLDYIISPTGGSTPAALAADQFHALPASILPKVKAAIASI